jgi:uncharacterized protein (DUF924 family)
MRTNPDPDAVLAFWFGTPTAEPTPARDKLWFVKSRTTDALIRSRFLATHEAAKSGALDHWLRQPRSCLAYIIATDQFPRNLFRDTGAAFATDALALAAARNALARGFEKSLMPIERVFLYLPFEHSEEPADQVQSVSLFAALREEDDQMNGYYQYALAHQRIIERFGRFPHRNALLGRASTAEEIAFLKEPGSRF